jgi:hypothetical protein
MDSTNNNTPEFDQRRDYRHLPMIVSIDIREVDFRAPKLKHFRSSLEEFNKALEFLVTTDGPIPAIASSPVLHVGQSAPIPLYEQVKGKENTFSFLAFKWGDLKPGEAIFWGWYNDPPDRWIKTKFTYKISGKK